MTNLPAVMAHVMVALNDENGSDKIDEVQAMYLPSNRPRPPVTQDDTCRFNLKFSKTQTQAPPQPPYQETSNDATEQQTKECGHGNYLVRNF